MKKYIMCKYVYLVISNNGFYMEPDYIIEKIFVDYENAKKYLASIRKKNKYVFILKKGLYL